MRTLTGSVVTLLAAAALAVPGASYAERDPVAKPVAPTVSPATRIPGEKLTVHGVVPGKLVRPVRLQGKVGATWATLATAPSKKTGAITFTTGTKATAVRLVAAKVKRGTTSYPFYRSSARAVGALVQKIGLTLPASSGGGMAVNAKLTLVPVRSGRPVTLQRLVTGSWATVTTVAANGSTLTIPFTAGAAGTTTSYRAVAAAWKGAPALTSPVRTLTVPSAAATRQVSTAMAGAQPDFDSTDAQTSADGRYVVFASAATNLVAGDSNMAGDIFEWDRTTGAIVKITPADGGGFTPAVSADGAYVAYQSTSANLVPVGQDTNGGPDVFLWSRATGTTTLVSHIGDHSGDAGSIHPDISADGRFVVFETTASDIVTHGTKNASDIVRYDRTTGTNTLVSTPAGAKSNGSSLEPAVSGDGRHVTYLTTATNLTSPPSSGHLDVVETDTTTGLTTLVSHAPGGGPGDSDSGEPTASSDGAYVAFASNASNLVPGDTNGLLDVFVWSRADGSVARVSHTPAGGVTHGRSGVPSISGDGRYVAFESTATDLVAADPSAGSDIFVWDRTDGAISLASRTPAGGFADGGSHAPSFAADGASLSFESQASDLVSGDTDARTDVFWTPR